MEFIIDSFTDGTNFVLIGVKEEKDLQKLALRMTETYIMSCGELDPDEVEKIKHAMTSHFMRLIETDKIEIYKIPMEKTIFGEKDLKLGQKINIEISKIK